MKKLLLITAVLVIALPFAASAQDDTLTWSSYISVDVDPGDDTVYCGGPWLNYCDLDSNAAIGLPLAGVTKVYIGIKNGYRPFSVKYFEITIHGTGVHLMGVDWVKGYLGIDKQSGVAEIDTDNTVPDELVVKYWIYPQPNWEIVCFSVNGATTINRIVVRTVCPVPTTTTYGLGVLALLLIGSTVWILRRKKAGAVA